MAFHPAVVLPFVCLFLPFLAPEGEDVVPDRDVDIFLFDPGEFSADFKATVCLGDVHGGAPPVYRFIGGLVRRSEQVVEHLSHLVVKLEQVSCRSAQGYVSHFLSPLCFCVGILVANANFSLFLSRY